ncbi:MAG: hypothetical protein JNJ54_16005 [Myxococcaceae bacterium]|nr:hypothetical protein [Myxococcaceae bacterium]
MLYGTSKVTTWQAAGFAARFCDSCQAIRPFQVRLQRIRTDEHVLGMTAEGTSRRSVDELECDVCGDIDRVDAPPATVAAWSPADGMEHLCKETMPLEATASGATASLSDDEVLSLINRVGQRGLLFEFFTKSGFWLGGAPGLLLGAGLAVLLLKVFSFDEVSTRFVIAAALGGGCLAGGLLTAIPRAKAARQTAQEVFLTAKLSRYSLSGAVQRLLLRLEARPELATLARNAVAKVDVHRR